MKKLMIIGLSALLMTCMVMVSQATYYGFCGDIQGWNNNAPNQFSSTTGGLYSFTTTVPSDTPGSHSGFTGNGYKILSQISTWNAYENNNSWYVTTTNNQVVTWYADPNQEDTSWSPSVNVIWSTAQVCTTGIYQAVGLDTWLGDTNGDYDVSAATHSNVMTSIGGGIYSLSFTFSTTTINPALAPVKAYKVALNNGWNEQIAVDGSDFFSTGNPGTLPVACYNAHDTVTLYVDTIKGKLKVVQAFPPVSGTAPWYAIGDITGAAQLPSTQMPYAGSGLYVLTTTATFSSNTHWVNVTDQAGNRHPTSAQTLGAFFSASSGQSVNITYDTNTHLDGWLPFTNFVYTTPTTTIGTHTYGVVGQNLTFFNLGASDWDTNLGIEYMNDTGANGDLVAGDNIWTWQGVVIASVSTLSLYNGKVLADPGTQGYTFQIGDDGKSISGNPPNNQLYCIAGDTIRVQCNVATGRVLFQNLTHPATANPKPSIVGSPGQPGISHVFTASGGTPAYVNGNPNYIGWTSSDTTKVQITGFSGTTANVSYLALGTSTVTVYDSLGQTGTYVAQVVTTSAPLAPESASSLKNSDSILWSINE